MPVGAGSIKRAAKLNADAAENTKTVDKAEKKAVEKKTTVEKKATAKSSATTKKSPVKNTVSKKEVVAVSSDNGNQVCHLTEELPIHLL